MRTNRNQIVISGDVILRYPLRSSDQEAIGDHADRQQRAHDAGLPVPAVLEVHAHAARPYMVMERVMGTPLMETDLTSAAQQRLAGQLIDFMHALWSVVDWPVAEPTWDVIWAVLARVVPDPQVVAAAEIAANAPQRLTHGDLSPGNLMVTTEGGLVGVLDWDAAIVSDPAMDWAALCSNTPPAVARGLRSNMPGAAELEQRAAAYIATWQVQHDLWLADEHPWLIGDRAVTEPRL